MALQQLSHTAAMQMNPYGIISHPGNQHITPSEPANCSSAPLFLPALLRTHQLDSNSMYWSSTTVLGLLLHDSVSMNVAATTK
jgi:hypothetical protein